MKVSKLYKLYVPVEPNQMFASKDEAYLETLVKRQCH
jgi:hypothetical protein